MGVSKFVRLGAALLTGLVASAAAYADTIKPAVIYDLGGKFDKSFNEGVFNGATKFAKETGIPFRDLEIQNDAQREQILRKFAKDGFSPILVPGFSWETALKKIAPEFPGSKFAIIDDVVDLPNVQSLLFRADEGSFLVGVIAATTSKTGKVGFVGGMDIPLISAFGCGYAQGVKYVKKDNTVIANMTGTDFHAWNDPVKGGELAKSQISQGADVVFAAAGATGQGVLKAASDAGKFGIGVDSNQDNLFPGKVLTSMLKRVDVATYDNFKAAKDGTWKGGVHVFGVKDGGVGYAEDEWNKAILSADAKKAAEAAKSDIVSGKIVVHNFMDDNKCPV